jgi:hypothetical protein
MKRIIDGVAYNTDTSTHIATSEYDTKYNHEDRPCEAYLYQTRGGAFFVWESIDTGRVNDVGEPMTVDRFDALSREDAEEWMRTGVVEVHGKDPFGERPEAVAEVEPGATIYVRLPALLKRRVEEAANAANQSVNAYAMHCLERCLSSPAE